MAAKPNQHGHANPIHPHAHPIVDTFRLVAETRRQATAIAESARSAVKNFYRNPVDLAAFIERHNTPVYVIQGNMALNACLFALGFEPGFIAPSDSKRYRWLQKALNTWAQLSSRHQKANCHFEHGVFVLTPPLFTVGYISHQLHHWLAFRSGMQGYSERAQQLYRKFWNEQNGCIGAEVYDMSVEDMTALKAAINRDLEALMFLKEIANEILIPAKQGQRLSHGTASA